ncbi:hypothetical protein IAD21_04762 [Abditibacteriota bacterium]|nr:hypothetical protein IAD21_04762 [Abditibacteriota bacterium]
MSLQTHGHCDNCFELNKYDRTHCHHCGEVLPWAFLVDPSLDEPQVEERPSWWARLTGHREKPKEKHKVRCLRCDGLIPYDAKVCFHCCTLLAKGKNWHHGCHYSDAPFLRILINAYIERHQPE